MKKKIASLLLAALVCVSLVGCRENSTAEPPTPAIPESQPAPAEQMATLYLPNEQADGFDELACTVPAGAQGLVQALVENGALPEGVKVNTFTQPEDAAEPLVLDVSGEFLEALRATGTAGESMYLGSLVNTFLMAYDAQAITLTCDGETIETGHAIYDEPLEYYDLTPQA